jgi:hypothetical protein
MDLQQTKLTKTEWNNTEIPVQEDEQFILQLIKDGFNDINIRINRNQSLLQTIKVENTPENEAFLYKKYLENDIKETIKKYGNIEYNPKIASSLKPPKKIDIIRIQNMDSGILERKSIIFEFVLIELSNEIMKHIHKKSTEYAFYLYTLTQLKKSTIPNVNKYVNQYIDVVIQYANSKTQIVDIIHRAYDFIEKNKYLLQYEDITLFPHQKQLYSICKQAPETPKLILYIAPTGTGKTLSPIGLSEKYRVIFICVSRHVGLALAKSAISMEKKIAFAFGCETASDIRLHYFAASNYTVNKRSGAIGKVDNSIGDKVEIMICDVQSYITAMLYMLAFNKESNIITYWDEPTITMDYPEHELHAKIHENWKKNKISKMVLSCATLPREDEIQETIMDFRSKFDGAEIHSINSYDFKKSIAILNKDGKCVLPHLLYPNYDDVLRCVEHCKNNKTLLRYFDLSEIIRYIKYVNQEDILESDYKINSYFTSITDITMNSLKLYYLKTLEHILRPNETWNSLYTYLKMSQSVKFPDNTPKLRRTTSLQQTMSSEKPSTVLSRIQSVDSNLSAPTQPVAASNSGGILLTTVDAHTLTDGPTIFLAENVEVIGKFYIQYSKIPPVVFTHIMDKIEQNNEICKQIGKTQKMYDDKMGFSKDSTKEDGDMTHQKNRKDKKYRKDDRKEAVDPEITKLAQQLDMLRGQIKHVNLDNIYIPNTQQHQEIWTETMRNNAYVPKIQDSTVKEIMELEIDNSMKILLLLGIGMFVNNPNVNYMEIMKRLAYEQKLYIIIASSDYIYGTNYSFCHGFIGKDLTKMTQQKIIQAMGRIGRNKIQQEYTIRFRDDSILMRLFEPVSENLEAINMSKLFCSDE